MYEFHANFSSMDCSRKFILNFMPFRKRNWVASHRKEYSFVKNRNKDKNIPQLNIDSIFHIYELNLKY